jgi:hypothetical protein
MKFRAKYKILFILIGLTLIALPVYSAHYPHTVVGLSSSNQINCKDCHEFHGDPSWGTGGFDLDNTFWDKLCYSCHNDVIAPSRSPHSSLQTDNSYGDWAVECKTCHDPHEHEQINWGASSYLYSSTVSNVLTDTPVAGQSTIVDASPSWTDGQFDASGDDFFVVAGDINEISNNVYKVISNSGSNLVVEGTVNTTKTSAGDTFAIILGKLVRATVVLDQIVTYTGVSTSVTSNSITETGAGWTTDQFAGLKLIPNAKLLNPIMYDITSNTSDTIYVSGTFSVTAGDPFQVVGGIINSPSGTITKTGNKSVRFFNRTGTNSFADGDSTYDGICEVCHTQTNYHRNNSSGDHTHNVGTTCTQCHDHTQGFKGAGDCISCHSTQQGTARRDVSPDFAKTSHHVSTGMPTNVLTCEACHGDLLTDRSHPGSATADPNTEVEDADTAGTYYTIDPSTADANLATFCLSCHDADGASRLGTNANKPFTDSGDNTAPPNINLAWTNTYNHSANATCNDCHGDNSAAGTTLDPKYNMHGSANNTILRESTEYDTCVTSGCHGDGTATTQFPQELSGTGGKHPIGSAVTPNSTVLQGDTGERFVNGWTKDSIAQCSDCHGMNQAGSINVGPRGPHGSAYRFMLRGVDTSISTGGTPTNSDATMAYEVENFCINCHNARVYGLGSENSVKNRGLAPDQANLSAIQHYSTFRTQCGATDLEKGQGSKQNIGCTNCHAGAGWNYGGHSSTGPLGKFNAGFMNGNSWDNSTPPGTKCYTGSGGAGATWNTCGRGDHGGY